MEPNNEVNENDLFDSWVEARILYGIERHPIKEMIEDSE